MESADESSLDVSGTPGPSWQIARGAHEARGVAAGGSGGRRRARARRPAQFQGGSPPNPQHGCRMASPPLLRKSEGTTVTRTGQAPSLRLSGVGRACLSGGAGLPETIAQCSRGKPGQRQAPAGRLGVGSPRGAAWMGHPARLCQGRRSSLSTNLKVISPRKHCARRSRGGHGATFTPLHARGHGAHHGSGGRDGPRAWTGLSPLTCSWTRVILNKSCLRRLSSCLN